MEDSDVVLRLTVEEAFLISEVLQTVRLDCELGIMIGGPIDKIASRRLNSDIDPIIAQLEAELETLGVR